MLHYYDDEAAKPPTAARSAASAPQGRGPRQKPTKEGAAARRSRARGLRSSPQAWRKPRRRARAAERRAVNPAEGLHQPTQSPNQNPEKGQNQSIKKEKTIKRLSRDKSKKKLQYAASKPHFYPKP